MGTLNSSMGLNGLVVVAALALAAAAMAQTPPPTCTGTFNPATPYDTSNMQLVATTTNGKLYVAGPPDNQINVVHVYGSSYEMGYAQGVLLKKEIDLLYSSFLPWIDAQVQPYLKFLPKVVADAIATGGIEAGLEVSAIMTEPWTPTHWLDEWQGLADGSGYSYRQVRNFNAFPELIKAACTIVGAWGASTGADVSYGNGTGLLALRLLDWGVENPMRLVPTLAVYHPSAGGGNTFAIQTFAGFVGALAGYSTESAVLEKVWIKSNETILEGRFGYPWSLLMRDILSYDDTLEAAYERMATAKRTASIWLGLGTRANGQFRVFEYSYNQLNEMDWNTPFPGYAPQPAAHPTIQDVVYVNKHTQPSDDPCLAEILQGNFGSLTTTVFEQQVAAFTQSGDLFAVAYDFDNNIIDVSVASQQPNANPIVPAYERQYLRFDAAALFAEPAPEIAVA